MKAKKNKREQSRADANRVSAGLQDVLLMTQWRKEHPHATWAEIEAAVDEQINQGPCPADPGPGAGGASQVRDPLASHCGDVESRRGFLQTTGGEAVKLTRTSGTCPTCGGGFFPAFMSS